MGVINQLSLEISNKIAAGEVVERPASVVKELVENAIDAGATAISVELEKGGISFLRVTDNGSGMVKEDATLCFSRHATSKIKTAEDLDAIYTLGFRGEALSSIGAVSRIEMFTKKRDASAGTRVVFEGGQLLSVEEAGAADGTSIIVKDLFYNTPARMKFLKKDVTEAGYVSDIVLRFILAHPEISFRLIRDGREVYSTSGDGSLKNALYSVYGREYAKAVIDIDLEINNIRITGVAGKSETSRPNRAYQSFFVNGRYIKSPAITRAVEEAYKNQIMIGKFPMAVIKIEINPQQIDINVHPTKMEVKFSDEGEIYRAVYHAVKNALYSTVEYPEIERNPEPVRTFTFAPEPERKPTPAYEPYKGASGTFSPARHQEPSEEKKCAELYEIMKADAEALRDVKYEPPVKAVREEKDPFSHTFLEVEESVAERMRIVPEERTWRIIGQLFRTYILVEEGDSLLLIDQHAAHERIKYEELKGSLKERKISAQYLAIPLPVELSETEKEAYEEHKDELSLLGFEAEMGDEPSITAVPAADGTDDLSAAFLELLTAFSENRQDIIDSKKERLLYTIACKAAIKANSYRSEAELEALVGAVFALDNINTCPHGRPIVIKMTKKEIEKEFGRTL